MADFTSIALLLQRMDEAEKYNDEEGYHYIPDTTEEGLQSFLCYNTASLIASQLGGKVFGYSFVKQDLGRYPNALGLKEEGHDFAVVDGFIVDWWAGKYGDLDKADRITPIKSFSEPQRWRLRQLYLPRRRWEEVKVKHMRLTNGVITYR